MLTEADKEEIKQIVGELLHEQLLSTDSSGKGAVIPGFVDVVARALDIFGSREKAIDWLQSPVRSLADRTPASLLDSSEGISAVNEVLGRIEHGVW